MGSVKNHTLPLITIGIVVFNREWIISEMLASVQSQTYPHQRLFILVVDGGSTDNTTKTAEQILAHSDFNGYELVIEKSNIPEARNICIQKMRGDFLLFWDSDVILKPDAAFLLFETIKEENADIVAAQVTNVLVDSIGEISEKLNEIDVGSETERKKVEANWVGMGQTLITKELLEKVAFDPDFTVIEDADFSFRAIEEGFRIVQVEEVIGLDVNSRRNRFSEVSGIDMSLRNSLRGIGKRAKVQLLAYKSPMTLNAAIEFFMENKRILFYLGYVPIVILMIYGFADQNLILALTGPTYLGAFMIFQIKKRGLSKGLKATMRSVIVGIPLSVLLVYYSLKLILRKKR